MDFKALIWLLLLAVVIVQTGCASSPSTTDDTPAELEPVASHDDSHGWGSNIQQTGGR